MHCTLPAVVSFSSDWTTSDNRFVSFSRWTNPCKKMRVLILINFLATNYGTIIYLVSPTSLCSLTSSLLTYIESFRVEIYSVVDDG